MVPGNDAEGEARDEGGSLTAEVQPGELAEVLGIGDPEAGIGDRVESVSDDYRPTDLAPVFPIVLAGLMGDAVQQVQIAVVHMHADGTTEIGLVAAVPVPGLNGQHR